MKQDYVRIRKDQIESLLKVARRAMHLIEEVSELTVLSNDESLFEHLEMAIHDLGFDPCLSRYNPEKDVTST